MEKYGESIYGTRGNVTPQAWGVITAKDKVLYVHVLKQDNQPYLFIPSLKEKVLSASFMADRSNVKFKQQPEGLFIYMNRSDSEVTDRIIQLKIQ